MLSLLLTMSDIKATHLYEKFILLFPSWEEKVVKYGRKGDTLVLHTRSLNRLYFWTNGTDWVLTTERRNIPNGKDLK